METKKYEFTGETKVWLDHTMHRIRARRSFGDVKAGDLGGWIEKEENLNHNGSAWVYGEALVFEDACVYESAKVSDSARVSGRAMVSGVARICGNASIGNTSHYLNIGPIGRRFAFTTFFRTVGKQIYVKCGCFCGNIDEFALRVQAIHGDNHHAKAYMAAVELAKAQIDLSEEE